MADSKVTGSADLKITLGELRKELDKYRPEPLGLWLDEVTPEQKDFIRECRNHERPISFPQIVRLWKRLGWPDVQVNTMQMWVAHGKI